MLLLEIVTWCEPSSLVHLFNFVLRVKPLKMCTDISAELPLHGVVGQILVDCRGLFSECNYSACREIHSQNVKANVKTNHVPSGKAAKKKKEIASDELPLFPN